MNVLDEYATKVEAETGHRENLTKEGQKEWTGEGMKFNMTFKSANAKQTQCLRNRQVAVGSFRSLLIISRNDCI